MVKLKKSWHSLKCGGKAEELVVKLKRPSISGKIRGEAKEFVVKLKSLWQS